MLGLPLLQGVFTCSSHSVPAAAILNKAPLTTAISSNHKAKAIFWAVRRRLGPIANLMCGRSHFWEFQTFVFITLLAPDSFICIETNNATRQACACKPVTAPLRLSALIIGNPLASSTVAVTSSETILLNLASKEVLAASSSSDHR